MDLHVRLDGGGDLTAQLYRELREAVRDGRLRPGTACRPAASWPPGWPCPAAPSRPPRTSSPWVWRCLWPGAWPWSDGPNATTPLSSRTTTTPSFASREGRWSLWSTSTQGRVCYVGSFSRPCCRRSASVRRQPSVAAIRAASRGQLADGHSPGHAGRAGPVPGRGEVRPARPPGRGRLRRPLRRRGGRAGRGPRGRLVPSTAGLHVCVRRWGTGGGRRRGVASTWPVDCWTDPRPPDRRRRLPPRPASLSLGAATTRVHSERVSASSTTTLTRGHRAVRQAHVPRGSSRAAAGSRRRRPR